MHTKRLRFHGTLASKPDKSMQGKMLVGKAKRHPACEAGNSGHQTFTFRGTLAIQAKMHARSFILVHNSDAWLCALRALNCVWHPGQGQCQQGWNIGQHKGSPAAMLKDDRMAKRESTRSARLARQQ